MPMTPHDRSTPLHNFSLPCLKWGTQRQLRCIKLTDHPRHGSPSSSIIPRTPIHLHSSMNSVPVPPLHPRFHAPDKILKLASSPSPPEAERPPTESPRPWNLRTRRSACKAPLKIEDKRNNIDSPRKTLPFEMDSPKRNADTSSVKRQQSAEMALMMKEKVKFCVSLDKEEIEEDFMEMARIRPPRRPKKRPRIVQKYLDSIFPGLWLSEVTPDSYKVAEIPES